MTPLQLHPVDWYNQFGIFKDIFRDDKNAHLINDTEAAYLDPQNIDPSDINRATFKLLPSGQVQVLKNNPFDIANGGTVSKFTILSAVKFKNDFRAAESHVMYKLMELSIPYVRVGTDYFKLIDGKNNWGGQYKELSAWSKDEMKEDHTKGILKHVPKYDAFCIEPDNVNYSPVHGNRYNLYVPFLHVPYKDQVTASMIPTSMKIMNHVFGSNGKLSEGFIWMKCLYEYPKQMLPILVLLSEKQGTGKTTFLDWLYMIFGDNSTIVNPESMSSEFNASYAKKNILMFEEAFFHKPEAAEKIKRLTTGKFIQLRDLYVSAVNIPLYCHLVMCSNKVHDFMRIEKEETRYFILEIPQVTGELNTRIDKDLFSEIPMFLKYLSQLPPIDFSQNRLVLTKEQTHTPHLTVLKNESKTWLHKELELHIEDFFNNNPDIDSFYAGSIDIKNEWFSRDQNVKASYISKVIRQELKMAVEKQQRYYPFGRQDIGKDRVSTPFLFQRSTK